MEPIDWSAVRVAVFDVDGTLYDARRLRRRLLRTIALHLARRPADLRRLRTVQRFRQEREKLAEEEAAGIIRRQYERPAALLGQTPEAVRAAVEEWIFERPLPLLAGCRFPGVRRLFAALRRQGVTIVAFSDYPVGDKLSVLGLEADREVSALDPEVDRLKPHPAGLERVLELTGRAAGECLMIGDRTERDAACARRVGMPWRLKVERPRGEPGTFHDYRPLAAELEG